MHAHSRVLTTTLHAIGTRRPRLGALLHVNGPNAVGYAYSTLTFLDLQLRQPRRLLVCPRRERKARLAAASSAGVAQLSE
jgi:hypothetical protein